MSINEKPTYVLKKYNTHSKNGQTIYEITVEYCIFGNELPNDEAMKNIKKRIVSGDLSALTMLQTEYFQYFTINQPAFIWNVKTAMMGIPVVGRDFFPGWTRGNENKTSRTFISCKCCR